ncbi:MAG: hypothetical protein CL920_15105 [Deltaproteobacteria bacterium]|nr:hypothetical protein [Deltaproteobacteria bacterium]
MRQIVSLMYRFGVLGGVTLIFVLMTWGLYVGCASCAKDSQCSGNMRCGPGGYCVTRCLVGESDACVDGFICDSTGRSCVKGTATTDAGISDTTSQPEGSVEAPVERE